MASRKTNEQCLTWLRSVAADKNSLDGINAELCINLIQELRDRLDKLGMQFNEVKKQRDSLASKKAQEHAISNESSKGSIYVELFENGVL